MISIRYHIKTRQAIIAFVVFGFYSIIYGQATFELKTEGLIPKELRVEQDELSTPDLFFDKAIEWIALDPKNRSHLQSDLHQDRILHFRVLKWNAVQQGKQAYHLRFTLRIQFDAQGYTFRPVAIETKLNSKYDMGWTAIDLNNMASFFKKGKPVKKTKEYVSAIPSMLNAIYTDVKKHVISP